jgi:membrane fusion protein (multidrug efflux system)
MKGARTMQRNHHVRQFGILMACLAGMMLTGCGKKDSAQKQQSPPEVGFVTIQPQRVVLTTDLPGRTAPHLIAEVRPQVGGIIQKRLFVEGTDVKAGQVLYQIDPATYEAALASARATQARAEATLNTNRLKAERYRELVKVNAVSKQDNDDAQAAFMQAEADLAAARAAVETARINLAYTRVTAPISGRIGRSSVTDGALVTASQAAPLATIQQLNPIYVDVTQSTAELLRLKQSLASGVMQKSDSARLKLLLEDGTPYPLAGTLKFSEVTVDQGTGSVTIRAIFPNPSQVLLPGMFVRGVVEEGVNEHALLVPQRGVSRNPKGEAVVLLVGPGEKVEQRVIQVVRTVGDNWLVSGGLNPGDRVILEGIQRARPGTTVKAVPFAGKPVPQQGQQTVAPQQTPAAKK